MIANDNNTAPPILGTLVAYVLEKLRESGQLPQALSRQEVQVVLASGAELPTDCFAHLYQTATAALATQLTKDDGHPVRSSLDTELLCRCVLSCRNLEDAMLRAADFCAAIAPRGGAIQLSTPLATPPSIPLSIPLPRDPVQHSNHNPDHNALFTIDSLRVQHNATTRLIDVANLFSYQQLFSWLIGEPLRIKTVWLTNLDQLETAPFLDLFGAEIKVGQARTGFEFDARQLARPVVRQTSELAGLLTIYPFLVLGEQSDTLSTAHQVQAFLNAALARSAAIPSSAEIAAAMSISDATLRRRLREEGTNYLSERERCLRRAAEYQLCNTNRDIEHIAAALGFSDSTAFRRAFHRWTGQAPSMSRRQARDKTTQLLVASS